MKLSSIVILEARKNPHLNPKSSINSIVRREYEKAGDLPIGIKNCFISFTNIEKLGINPKSKYKTPIGIYCYPSEYVLDETIKGDEELSMTSLPFVGSQQFGNIFSVTGNIIRIDNFSNDDFNSYFRKLQAMVKKRYSRFEGMNKQLRAFLHLSIPNALVKSPGGCFWYVMRETAMLLSSHTNSPASLCWTTLFKQIGIDGVVDMGSGIIHGAEPTQAVFFGLRTITNIVRVENKYSSSEVDKNKALGEKMKQIIADINNAPINKIVAYPQLIKYVTDEAKRSECIDSRPDIIEYMGVLTKRDILLSLKFSELMSIEHFTIPTKVREYSKEEFVEDLQNALSIGEDDYQDEDEKIDYESHDDVPKFTYAAIHRLYVESNRRDKIIDSHKVQIKQLITEQDLITLVSSMPRIYTPCISEIFKVFPYFTKLLDVFLQRLSDDDIQFYLRDVPKHLQDHISKYLHNKMVVKK